MNLLRSFTRCVTLVSALSLPAAVLGQTATPPATPPPAAPAADQFPDSPGAAVQPKPQFTPTGPAVIIDTTMGRLTCKLFTKEAPVTTANFIGLAEGTKDFTDPITLKLVHGQRFYDGTTFHRVIPGFMIQGGDRKGDGTGDGGFYFDQEIVPGLTFDVPGRMAMANAGANTNGTQFFITEAPQPALDGSYNIFGQCDAASVALVAAIARVDRNSQDKPYTPVVMNHITIVRDGDPMPPAPAVKPAPPAATPPAN